MEFFKPYTITIPPDTELNCGPSEDSDSFGITKKPLKALVVRSAAEGALPIQIFENDEPVGGIIYFHQPPAQ